MQSLGALDLEIEPSARKGVGKGESRRQGDSSQHGRAGWRLVGRGTNWERLGRAAEPGAPQLKVGCCLVFKGR